VQTYRNSKWSVDSVFDDHQLAVFEARRMDESGRFGGVRVVEEIWDPNTNRTSTRTVFRDWRQQVTESKQRRVDRTQGYSITRAREKRDRIRKKSNPIRLLVITIAILGAAMAAGLFLDRIERMFN
jgi:predicted metal-dependent peptidase